MHNQFEREELQAPLSQFKLLAQFEVSCIATREVNSRLRNKLFYFYA